MPRNSNRALRLRISLGVYQINRLRNTNVPQPTPKLKQIERFVRN